MLDGEQRAQRVRLQREQRVVGVDLRGCFFGEQQPRHDEREVQVVGALEEAVGAVLRGGRDGGFVCGVVLDVHEEGITMVRGVEHTQEVERHHAQSLSRIGIQPF